MLCFGFPTSSVRNLAVMCKITDADFSRIRTRCLKYHGFLHLFLWPRSGNRPFYEPYLFWRGYRRHSGYTSQASSSISLTAGLRESTINVTLLFVPTLILTLNDYFEQARLWELCLIWWLIGALFSNHHLINWLITACLLSTGTAGFILCLSHLYPKYIAGFGILITLDIVSHWIQMYR